MPYEPEDPQDARLRELAKSAQGGAEEAFAQLYEQLSPALLTWADYRLRAGRRLDPLDVVQEVWCRAWRRLEAWDAERVPFRAWLFRIAKNVAMEGLRKAQGAGPEAGGPSTRLFALANLPDSVTAVSRRMMKQESLASFRGRIEALEEDERRLVVHCGLEGLPLKEVATRLELTEAAVGKRWQRLRQRLVEQGLPETLLTSA